MKFVKLFLLAAVLFTFSYYSAEAQNIKIYKTKAANVADEVTGDTLVIQYTPTGWQGWDELEIFLFAKNFKSTKMIMMATKREVNFKHASSLLESHRICFGIMCYTENDYTSLFSSHVQSNNCDTTFSGHYGFEAGSPIHADALVAYTIYDSLNMADSATIFVRYKTTISNSISDVKNATENAFHAWPNPASDIVSINYKINNSSQAYLVVSNALGEIVKTQSLLQGSETTTFDTKDLPSGIYYYSIIGDNNNTSKTNKLIVSH